jgi:hypothetical protein
MRGLGGVILLTGIGVGLFVYLPTPADSGIFLDRLQRIVASRLAQPPPAQVAYNSRLRAFSPSITLSMPIRSEPLRAGHATPAVPPSVSEPPQAAIASDAQMGWQTIVSTATPARIELTPRDPSARHKLVLAIQQELRRVGCYGGRLDGSWDYALKNAMKEFTDRVNATLPLDEPDYIQLTLIQSESDGICSACPAGKSLSASGRCAGLSDTVRAVAATRQEVLPWKANALYKPVPGTVRYSEPLPGRMAIGAPVPTSVDAQQDSMSLPPGTEDKSLRTAIATLETVPLDPAAVEQPVTAARKVARRSSSSRRSARSPGRRFAVGAATQRARSYRRSGPGTPRHNLLLSLGGVY